MLQVRLLLVPFYREVVADFAATACRNRPPDDVGRRPGAERLPGLPLSLWATRSSRACEKREKVDALGEVLPRQQVGVLVQSAPACRAVHRVVTRVVSACGGGPGRDRGVGGLVAPLGESGGGDLEFPAEGVEGLALKEPQDDLDLSPPGPSAVVEARPARRFCRPTASGRVGPGIAARCVVHGRLCSRDSRSGVSRNRASIQHSSGSPLFKKLATAHVCGRSRMRVAT